MRRMLLLVPCLLCGCAATTNAGSLVSPSTTATPSVAASVGTASASPAATVTPFPAKSVTPSATPTYTGSRTLVESDSGATINLRVGEIVTVSLPSEYDTPNAQGDVLARTSSTGGYPTGKPLDAMFGADKVGRTDITSTTDYACLHAQPMCMIPQREWIVHVVVS
ncbi:MAG TPA: hypothetical protein VKV69_02065 [Actinomycetota bacterium]|nr:hypothetical protein [Actinomycetota bacterium]